jgi:hypothetical protein
MGPFDYIEVFLIRPPNRIKREQPFDSPAVDFWRHAPLSHTPSDCSGATSPVGERVGEESSHDHGHAYGEDDDPGNYEHDAEGQGKSQNDERNAEDHR